jgi:hypothetical protein
MASIISAGTTDSTSLNISSDRTGILQLASNNAVTAVTIDASQNVGIGTASPGTRLDVVGASATSAAIIKPQGSLPNNNDNAGLYVLHQGTGGAAFRVRTDTAVSATQFAHILINNASAACTGLQVDQYGTGNIVDFTKSGTSALRIDNSGRITTPYQPAFSAYRGSLTLATQTWTTIVYDNCTINRGSCYSTSTGRFTAPVAGYYYFEAIGEGGGGAFHTLMSVNGGTPAGQGDGAQNWTSSNVSRQAFVLSLAAGDYVYVQHYIDAGKTMTSNRCHFHGYLLG